MTELELLRAENRGLRERSEAFDVGLGGVLETAAASIETFRTLAQRFENDPAAQQLISDCLAKWDGLLDEVVARMKAFSALPNQTRTN